MNTNNIHNSRRYIVKQCKRRSNATAFDNQQFDPNMENDVQKPTEQCYKEERLSWPIHLLFGNRHEFVDMMCRCHNSLATCFISVRSLVYHYSRLVRSL